MMRLSLSTQVQIYSVETNAYYTDSEYILDQELNNLRNYKNLIKNEIKTIEKYKNEGITRETAIKRIFNLNENFKKVPITSEDYVFSYSEDDKINRIINGTKYRKEKREIVDIVGIDDKDIIKRLKKECSLINKKITDTKESLLKLLKSNTSIRTLRSKFLNEKNIISIFESSLTRTLGMGIDKLNDGLIIVRVYYFNVANSLVNNGFMCNGEKYVYLTSSAGQIRTKKMVFIKESLWSECHDTLMCGLSVDKINSKGGINRNKYLAYLALCNSATDLWEDFDMTKAIVVDDFETTVNGEVDFFDDKTYEIKRQIMDVSIAHTDGCGLMLPSVCDKNRMFRGPWMKGLLSPFDFRKFIKKNGGSTKIKDIYGKEYDIFGDDIRVILTKSQFKMWKHYSSWQKYLDYYKKYNCTAGYCNEELDDIPYAKINYQMLQTLTDITDDELEILASKTNYKIKNITSNVDTVKEVFGADKVDENSSHLQQAINIFPEILSDVYCKEKIKLIKASIVKNARAGKLNLDAKYTFIIPDLYAFCEFLFLGKKNPDGMLGDGEVYCSLFKKSRELDCLRSPHLYREHAVRNNIYDKEKEKWFITKGLYVSCKDLISKLIMNDWDGDTSLVCSDKLLIDIAKRNMKDVVPLYYEMASAAAETINNKKLFDGLSLAFTSGNIGEISNDITKIENSDNIDWDVVKILTAENNYTIDYAKTLYKPTRPEEIDLKIRKLTNCKVPHFFKFAKDKTDSQVERPNNSTVNRLYKVIHTGRLNYKFENADFDYRMLMKNQDVDIYEHDKICKVYDLFKHTTYNASANTDKAIEKRIANFKSKREKFEKYFYDTDLIVDVLVKYLYCDGCNSKYKDILWYCFGDILINNLKYNLERRHFVCCKCNRKFYAESWNQRLCKRCSKYSPIGAKVLVCCDCGSEFEVDARNTTKVRCSKCYAEYRKQKIRENVARHRDKK